MNDKEKIEFLEKELRVTKNLYAKIYLAYVFFLIILIILILCL